MKIGDYETHPIADAFPLLEGRHYDGLKALIVAHGLLDNRVWLYEGKLLDGRNRYRVALELGLKVKVEEYEGDDPIGFARAKNLDGRRNMSPSVCAMTACRLLALRPAKRGRKSRTSTDLTIGEVAKQLGVSSSSVEDAQRVLAKGAPELVAAVDQEDVTLSEALELAPLSHDKQREALKGRAKETTPRARRAAVRNSAAAANENGPTPKVAGDQLVRAVRRAIEHLGATIADAEVGSGRSTISDLRIAYAGRIYTLVLRDTGGGELLEASA